MTEAELDSLDHIDDEDYWDHALSDEELQIPSYMVPPDPDDSDCLPSNVHISYPYGDPTRLTHPASQANRYLDPNSRAIYDDTGSGGAAGGMGNVNVGMVWKDLALDLLLPVDPAKEEAARAAKARRLANGTQGGDGDGEVEERRHSDSDIGFDDDPVGPEIEEMEPELEQSTEAAAEEEEEEEEDEEEEGEVEGEGDEEDDEEEDDEDTEE